MYLHLIFAILQFEISSLMNWILSSPAAYGQAELLRTEISGCLFFVVHLRIPLCIKKNIFAFRVQSVRIIVFKVSPKRNIYWIGMIIRIYFLFRDLSKNYNVSHNNF